MLTIDPLNMLVTLAWISVLLSAAFAIPVGDSTQSGNATTCGKGPDGAKTFSHNEAEISTRVRRHGLFNPDTDGPIA